MYMTDSPRTSLDLPFMKETSKVMSSPDLISDGADKSTIPPDATEMYCNEKPSTSLPVISISSRYVPCESSWGNMIQYLLAEEEKGNEEAKEALKNLWEKAIREDIDRLTPKEKSRWEIELKGKLKDEIKRKRKEEGD